MKTCSTHKNSTSRRILITLLFYSIIAGLVPFARAETQVYSLDGNILGVHFDQPLDDVSATAITNYTVYGKAPASGTGLNVTNAVLQSDGQTVALSLDSNVGEFFAVSITNVLNSFGTNISNTTVPGCLYNLATFSIGTTNDPVPLGSTIAFNRDTFNIIASGSDIGGTNDHCHIVGQPVTGNFEAVVHVNQLDIAYPNAKASLMARENLNPGSRAVEIHLTPLLGGIGELVMTARTTSDTTSSIFGLTDVSSLSWLRMTRTNNNFTVYYGTNGINWTALGSISNAWNTTVVGAAATSGTNGQTTTVGFDSFGVGGARPGDDVVPALNVSIYSNNLVASWSRTPRDFAVQVTDNLLSTTLGGSLTNSGPAWAFLLLPIYDTDLTGTNAAMAKRGRYMTIPMNLFTNGNAMYVRLARVEKVFPDPIDVKGGITLSQAAGNLTTTAAGNSLCGDTVDTATALATTNSTYVICGPTNIYQFTTANSGSSLHTVIQVRKSGSLTVPAGNCDGVFTASNNKSQVTFPKSVSITNYTFVVAATTNAKPTLCCPLVVDIKIK